MKAIENVVTLTVHRRLSDSGAGAADGNIRIAGGLGGCLGKAGRDEQADSNGKRGKTCQTMAFVFTALRRNW
jgi:hypothetical protein